MKKFKVFYPRTLNWYSSPDLKPGRWYALSTWCNEAIGPSSITWDYMGEYFLFMTEEDELAFRLRWL